METESRYHRVFRNTLVALLLFFVLFLIGLYFLIGVYFLHFPAPDNPISSKGLYSPFFTGPASVGAAYRLFQLNRQHQRFKNTGYDYPYPKDV